MLKIKYCFLLCTDSFHFISDIKNLRSHTVFSTHPFMFLFSLFYGINLFFLENESTIKKTKYYYMKMLGSSFQWNQNSSIWFELTSNFRYELPVTYSRYFPVVSCSLLEQIMYRHQHYNCYYLFIRFCFCTGTSIITAIIFLFWFCYKMSDFVTDIKFL